ncbi:MAG: hypothetical protein MJ252_13440 [archaeon]|nr:hypothetical protein [archaeon]
MDGNEYCQTTLLNSELIPNTIIPHINSPGFANLDSDNPLEFLMILSKKLSNIPQLNPLQEAICLEFTKIFLKYPAFGENSLSYFSLEGLAQMSGISNKNIMYLILASGIIRKIIVEPNIDRSHPGVSDAMICLVGNFLFQVDEAILDPQFATEILNFIMGEINIAQGDKQRNCFWALTNLASLSSHAGVKIVEDQHLVKILSIINEAPKLVAKEAVFAVISLIFKNENNFDLIMKIIRFNTFDMLINSIDTFNDSNDALRQILEVIYCLFEIGEKMRLLSNSRSNFFVEGFFMKGGEEKINRLATNEHPKIREIIQILEETYLIPGRPDQ